MSLKILYIEDDAALAMVTTRALTARGFDVAYFTAVNTVDVELQVFNMALLDLKLEEGLSLPFIQQLLVANPTIKIVILTGYASIATAVQAIKLGATNYLAKPATIDQILMAFEGNTESAPAPIDKGDDKENMSLRRLEWEHIQQALAENNGNISATARQLKMHRRTLQRKLSKKPVAE